MLAAFKSVAARFGAILALFVGLLITVFTLGKKNAQVKASEQMAAKKEADAVRTANEIIEGAKSENNKLQNSINVGNDNASLSDSDVNNKLREKWTRD